MVVVINDGPLMQSDIVLEGLAGTAMRPTAEGPLLVKCIDPKTQAVVFKVDPHALYVPDCKVQVFSSDGPERGRAQKNIPTPYNCTQ